MMASRKIVAVCAFPAELGKSDQGWQHLLTAELQPLRSTAGPGIPMSQMEIPQVLGVEQLRDTISRHIRYTLARPSDGLKPEDYLKPLALAIRDRLVDKMLE